jgi:hypothetical protein
VRRACLHERIDSVSEAMILVSGKFTDNAKERILANFPDPVWRGNVSFFDRPAIEALIRNART